MVAFKLWSINIYRYWIFYLIAFVVWYFFLKFLAKKKVFVNYPWIQEILDKKIEDIIIFVVLWVLIWWRAWHFLIYYLNDLLANPIIFFKVWEWWMSFIWWMIWVTLWILLFTKINKLKFNEFWLLIDIILIVAPVWIIFWRLGNFLNQELYWLIVPLNNWWFWVWFVSFLKSFHVYSQIDHNFRLNTNFLSIIFEWFLSLWIIIPILYKRIRTKKINPGLITWIFLINYSFWRFLFEYLRQDSSSEFIWMFSKSQYFFIMFFLIWLVLTYFSIKKKQL